MPQNWSKVRVTVWEMDRFSGRSVFARKEFDTSDLAEAYVKKHNEQNTESDAPDWYTYAEVIG